MWTLTSEQQPRSDKRKPAPYGYHWISCTAGVPNRIWYMTVGVQNEAPQAAVLTHSFCFSMRQHPPPPTYTHTTTTGRWSNLEREQGSVLID